MFPAYWNIYRKYPKIFFIFSPIFPTFTIGQKSKRIDEEKIYTDNAIYAKQTAQLSMNVDELTYQLSP